MAKINSISLSLKHLEKSLPALYKSMERYKKDYYKAECEIENLSKDQYYDDANSHVFKKMYFSRDAYLQYYKNISQVEKMINQLNEIERSILFI